MSVPHDRSEPALARRLVASLALETLPPHQKRESSMSEPITTEAAPARHRIEPDFTPHIAVATELEPKPAASAPRPKPASAKIAPAPDAAPASPFAGPYEAVS